MSNNLTIYRGDAVSFDVTVDCNEDEAAKFTAISTARDELSEVDDPDISVAICAELDNTPFVDNKEPVIPFETLTLPVNV